MRVLFVGDLISALHFIERFEQGEKIIDDPDVISDFSGLSVTALFG